MVELRLLRAFVAVAEELHFTRAAERVFLTQPALTHQIQRLEAELGLRLFDRTSRRVDLTPEGQQLLVLSREVLGTLDRGLTELRATTQPRVLRLGYTDYLGYTPIPEAVRLYQRAHPQMMFEHVEGTTQEQLDGLASGTLDIGFFIAAQINVPGVRSSRLWNEPLLLALAEGHPLAAQTQLPFAALQDQRLLLNARETHPQMYTYLQELFRSTGVYPQLLVNTLPRIHSFGGVMRLVAEGMGGFLTVKSMGVTKFPGVRFQSLVNPEPQVPFRMAWRSGLAPDTHETLLQTIRYHTAQVGWPK